MRTFVITGTLILATGFAAYASTARALDARALPPATTSTDTLSVDPPATNPVDASLNDGLRALGAAILDARSDAHDHCALKSLS